MKKTVIISIVTSFLTTFILFALMHLFGHPTSLFKKGESEVHSKMIYNAMDEVHGCGGADHKKIVMFRHNEPSAEMKAARASFEIKLSEEEKEIIAEAKSIMEQTENGDFRIDIEQNHDKLAPLHKIAAKYKDEIAAIIKENGGEEEQQMIIEKRVIVEDDEKVNIDSIVKSVEMEITAETDDEGNIKVEKHITKSSVSSDKEQEGCGHHQEQKSCCSKNNASNDAFHLGNLNEILAVDFLLMEF